MHSIPIELFGQAVADALDDMRLAAPGDSERLALSFGLVPPLRARLFVGVYPTGLSYADKGHEKDGDYAKVAHLSYATLELTVYDAASPLLPLVEADAAEMKARRGEEFRISACNQTVLLGGGFNG